MSIQYVSILQLFKHFSKTLKTTQLPLPKKFQSVPRRISSEFATKGSSGSTKKDLVNYQIKNMRTPWKDNFTA